jgi:thioredoxin-dependent peroxiredoxin
MIQVGDKIPEFSCPNQDGQIINSQDFLGKKLVLFFYPKADTSGCTAEACNLNEHLPTLQAQGFAVLGVSADPEKKQKKFHDKFEFQYHLLADESKAVCEAFGVWQLKKFMGREFMGIVRTTFVFDEQLICTEVISKVDTKNHTQQILK